MSALHTFLAWTLGLLRLGAIMWLLVVSTAGVAWVARWLASIVQSGQQAATPASRKPAGGNLGAPNRPDPTPSGERRRATDGERPGGDFGDPDKSKRR